MPPEGNTMLHEQIATAPAQSLARQAQERTFRSHDGTEIFYRFWPAVSAEARGAVVLFHRGHEHGGRMAHLIEELRMPDRAFYAWDARGNGRSAGERGYAPSFAALVRDIDCFMREIAARDSFDMQDIALIAQSFGAVLAAAWVHDYATKLRAMALASPAFSVKFYVIHGSRIKGRDVLPGCFHDTLGQRDRVGALGLIRPFLECRFAAPAEAVDLKQADVASYTRDEADRFAPPLDSLSPKGLYWA